LKFTALGLYSVSLSVENANGTSAESKTNYIQVVGLNSHKKEKIHAIIYPNPSSGITYIKGLPSGTEYRGYDLSGRLIVQGIADGVRAGIGAVQDAARSVASAVANVIPGSPVAEGPLTVLNNGAAGFKIAEMLSGGIQQGKSLVSSAAESTVSPVAMAASAGTGTSNSSTFAPTVTINVNGGGNPQAVGEEVKRQVAELFAQFQQQQSRQNWLSYS
jgi:PKD repeat protein